MLQSSDRRKDPKAGTCKDGESIKEEEKENQLTTPHT